VGPRAGLHEVEKKKIVNPTGTRTPTSHQSFYTFIAPLRPSPTPKKYFKLGLQFLTCSVKYFPIALNLQFQCQPYRATETSVDGIKMYVHSNEAIISEMKVLVMYTIKTHTHIHKYESNCDFKIYGMKLSNGKQNYVTDAQREEVLVTHVLQLSFDVNYFPDGVMD
jgi:hypothetical protein